VKSFNVTFEYVLYEISYENVILYSRTLPSYNPDKNNKDKKSSSDGKVLTSKEDINKFMLEHTKK